MYTMQTPYIPYIIHVGTVYKLNYEEKYSLS